MDGLDNVHASDRGIQWPWYNDSRPRDKDFPSWLLPSPSSSSRAACASPSRAATSSSRAGPVASPLPSPAKLSPRAPMSPSSAAALHASMKPTTPSAWPPTRTWLYSAPTSGTRTLSPRQWRRPARSTC
ncbi:hypothetical protein Cni_G19748 [Canna indica]|uniref:Uncharacterized protein n=1 Tax=Canna indica TaxID=4628 RepID=A0AAQ3KNR2_9LILI|nr:hypothetical protein Cni_G19748 [Canna indica]